MTNANLWNQILIWPITNILVAFYKFCEWLHIPGPLGWAVILMTLFIRLILYPLMNAQMKSAKKMADLKPHLDAINAKHKEDKAALQQAQMALYKEHGINPAAGCLPLLVQMPVLIALYNVFNQVLNNGNMSKVISEINQIVYLPALKLTSIDMSFFGTNLGIKPADWQKSGWWLLAIPVITGLLQYFQGKLMMPQSAKLPESKIATQNSSINKSKSQLKGQNLAIKKDENSTSAKATADKPAEDTAMEMQKQMAIISPLMFGWFAFQFPLGLALYWNVFGLFGIMQQLKINKQNSINIK
jgi:YidC/Oxa1 family membrane protein insertase